MLDQKSVYPVCSLKIHFKEMGTAVWGPAEHTLLRQMCEYERTLIKAPSTLTSGPNALRSDTWVRVSARISDLPREGFCLHFPKSVVTGSQAP